MAHDCGRAERSESVSEALELTGFDDLEALIEKLPELALAAGEVGMQRALLFLHGQLPPYPPQRAGATYRRTGTLGRGFTTQTTRFPDAVLGEIGTRVAYAPWVVGPRYPGTEIRGRVMYQARGNRRLWWRFDEVMDASKDAAFTVFADEFRQEFGRLVSEVPG